MPVHYSVFQNNRFRVEILTFLEIHVHFQFGTLFLIIFLTDTQLILATHVLHCTQYIYIYIFNCHTNFQILC